MLLLLSSTAICLSHQWTLLLILLNHHQDESHVSFICTPLTLDLKFEGAQSSHAQGKNGAFPTHGSYHSQR